MKHVPNNRSVLLGGTLDPDTKEWVSRVNAAGGSVGSSNKRVADRLIRGIKRDNLWSSTIRIWMLAFASEDQKQGLVPIGGGVIATLNGSFTTFDANGYKGNGSTGWIDTNISPSSLTATGTNATLGVYVFNDRAASPLWAAHCSGAAGADAVGFLPHWDSTTTHFGLMSDATGFLSSTSSTPKGQNLVTRTGVNAVAMYYNGVPFGSDTNVPSGITTTSLGIAAANVNGSPSGFSTDNLGCVYFIPQGLTAVEAATFMTKINTCMNDLGKAVY